MFHGEDVRELRTKLGRSRTQLASEVGASRDEVVAWEEGRAQPTLEQLSALFRLADSSGLPFDPFRRSPPLPQSPALFADPRLERVKALLENRYSEHISLHDAACVACLEEKYFSKFFRKKVGLSFSTWLAKLRLQKAQEKLIASEEPISEIAYSVGFQSFRTFERRFKQFTGLRPKDFRSKRRATT